MDVRRLELRLWTQTTGICFFRICSLYFLLAMYVWAKRAVIVKACVVILRDMLHEGKTKIAGGGEGTHTHTQHIRRLCFGIAWLRSLLQLSRSLDRH